MSAEQVDKLAEMIADLQGHIVQRAQEIAEPRIAEAHAKSQAALTIAAAKAAGEEQRLGDLVAELRRQVDGQVRRAERAEAAVTRARALPGRSSMGRVNDYILASDLRVALDGPGGERP